MRRCLYVGKIFTIISWQNWPSASIFGWRQKGRGFKSHKERKEMKEEKEEALKLESELESVLLLESELVMESLEWEMKGLGGENDLC